MPKELLDYKISERKLCTKLFRLRQHDVTIILSQSCDNWWLVLVTC